MPTPSDERSRIAPDPAKLIAEARQKTEKATYGPWCWYSYGDKCYAFAVATGVDGQDQPLRGCVEDHQAPGIVLVEDICYQEGPSQAQRDVDFIAFARTAVPQLADALEAARAREKRVRGALRTMRSTQRGKQERGAFAPWSYKEWQAAADLLERALAGGEQSRTTCGEPGRTKEHKP